MLAFIRRLFTKPEPVAVAPAPKPMGFFSTHFELPDFSLSDTEQAQVSFARTFQRGIKDMQAVKFTAENKMAYAEDGSPVMVAMDEAYPDLQLAKMQNTLYGYLSPTLLAWFGSQSFIGYQTAAMLAQNWLIDKACTMPARDAIRHGWEITVNDGSKIDPKILDHIRRLDKKFKIKQNLVELLRFGRIFGVRVLIFEVESSDPEYYFKPFNIDGIKPGSYKGISQIDPYWITPLLDGVSASNPASSNFYEPTWWMVNGKRYHRTHLIIMKNGGELPDILKPTYFYGGISVPQKIAERVFASERTANEAPLLALSKRSTVLHTDISQVMANVQTFMQKMGAWMQLLNNFGVKIVGENELIEQFDTSMADMDETIMTQYQIVAAASDVPATKLLGTSPKGFGASGEYEEASYHEMLESLQEDHAMPTLERHYELLVASELKSQFGKDVQIIPVFKPTDTPTAKEQAEINKLKSENDNQLAQAGAIDGTDIRQRIIQDPDSGYTGIEDVVPGGPGDREAQQEAEAALEQPVQASNKQKASAE